MKKKVSLFVALLLFVSSISVKSLAQENNDLSIADKKFYKWEKPQFQKIDFVEVEKKQYDYKKYLIELNVLKGLVEDDFKKLKTMFKELKAKKKALDKEEDSVEDKEDFYKDDYKILKKQKKWLEKERKKILKEKKELAKNPKKLSVSEVHRISEELVERLEKNESETKKCKIKTDEVEKNLLEVEYQDDLLDLREIELKERKMVLKKYEDDLEFLEDMIKMKKKFIKKQMKVKKVK